MQTFTVGANFLNMYVVLVLAFILSNAFGTKIAKSCEIIYPNKCGYNEKYVKCKTICPPQSCNISYTEYTCGPKICEPGCDCIKDHLRNSSNICIPNNQCPPPPTIPPETSCGLNEVYSDCKRVCPPQTCASKGRVYICDGPTIPPCVPGCNCIDGYLRDANNNCIPNEKCPPAPSPPTQPECGRNEVYSDCKIVCPPQSCESVYRSYACDGLERPCISGCNCIDGYLRDTNNTCIPNEQCPPAPTLPECGENEVATNCRIVCPPQTCSAIYSKFPCKETPCESGCDCIDGYRRDANNKCIPANKCPGVSTSLSHSQSSASSSSSSSKSLSSSFATSSSSASSGSTNGQFCEPTCAQPNPPNCPSITRHKSTKIRTCQDGYILTEKGGKCIKIEDCPKGCNGDPNAIAKACPAGCPSTCEKPNALPCSKQCEPLGCECAFGYLRSEINGKCIVPQDCPGGNPCSSNETFVSCKSGCPTDYCPQDDSRAIVACDPIPYPLCLSGCICKLNHKRLSREDNRCIVSSECPPVNCTRPNEEWNPCPSECQGEYCDSANEEPVTCNTLVLNCQPKCTCKKNFFRNADDICIPAKDCPKKLN